MASPKFSEDHSSYSDKQIVSSVDHGIEVVRQPYPDAYAYANPNNTNNDSSKGGSGGGGLEAVHHLLSNDQENPASSKEKSNRKICGLRSRTFIIVIAVVTALVVAAIIGGSIGGVLANKHSADSAKADSAEVKLDYSDIFVRAFIDIVTLKTSTTSPAPALSTTVTTTSASATSATSEPAVSTSSPSSSSTTSTTGTTSTSTSSTAAATTSSSGEGTYNCPADNNTNYVSPLLSTATWTILCDTDWPSGVDSFSGGTVVDLTAVIAYSIEACVDQCAAYNVAGGNCEAVVYGANITLALSRGGIQGNCFLKSDRGEENIADNSGQVEAAYLLSAS
ncbi:hypothetical protein Z517_08578 [Fonsecaea pedrosoi CBS 271.37]|uniref:Unplaced genomic scaffold supercont1.5, whole genome shotgun sequence n=1 Tax=Fonsecaea pedrosoi CBS 271.37 TaxID=1442368 RepID=A0A0D2H252_9EURO|nr:uncharacterized protein Z517_08578 [Fonsecaea pedrosoi CBS 271.37]KIW78739.1 hypothetical protein Z517_08578 [Fonsecaea pedrosoi CBS 271.37]